MRRTRVLAVYSPTWGRDEYHIQLWIDPYVSIRPSWRLPTDKDTTRFEEHTIPGQWSDCMIVASEEEARRIAYNLSTNAPTDRVIAEFGLSP